MIGRLSKDPVVNATQNAKVARITLAVDRRFKQDGQPTADFINCIAFGKQADFIEKYLKKGVKVATSGRIQTGSYTNRDGQKVFTTDVVLEEVEFCESKSSNSQNAQPHPSNAASTDGFMEIPDNIDGELPFN